MHSGILTGAAFVGLLVGILVGLTGIGGGLLLAPLLISVLGVPPLVAVGSDAVISCLTKVAAGGLYWYQGNVRWRLVLRLACGSLPGATLGVLVLTHIRGIHGSAVDNFLRVSIGVLLVVIPISYLAGQSFRMANPPCQARPSGGNEFGITIVGVVAGFLVGVTSIGAGSFILMMLMIAYRTSPAVTVGTDIAHGALLAGVAGLLQFKLVGNVDLTLAASVMAGCLPGSVVGAYLASRVSSGKLKRILCTLMVLLGARMLWEVASHTK